MLGTDFSPWPAFTQEEADTVARVLLSNRVNYWTGEEGRAFEAEFADFAESDYAVALANGTVALDTALRVVGVASGDEVIVTPRSFVASASTVVNAGATPVFVDVDRDSQNINADTITANITERTRAIICVHLAGWPCEMDGIMELARAHGLFVIEDCAQAHGARYKGRSVGGIGHIGCWSFCQDKIMSTGGEGGMITTSDPDLWAAAWSWKDHGKTRDAVYHRDHPPGFRWLHERFGTNLRMTEMQAALGRLQLGRMPAWHQARTENAHALLEAAADCPGFRAPLPPDHVEHAWYKCLFFVNQDRLRPGWTRERVVEAIGARGVPCMSGFCSEVYREESFRSAGLGPPRRLPVARELGETSVMMLVHPTLSETEISRSCEAVREVGLQAAQ